MAFTDSYLRCVSDRGGWTGDRKWLSAEDQEYLATLIPFGELPLSNEFWARMNELFSNTVADWCKSSEFQSSTSKRKRQRGRAASVNAPATPKLITLIRNEQENLRLTIDNAKIAAGGLSAPDRASLASLLRSDPEELPAPSMRTMSFLQFRKLASSFFYRVQFACERSGEIEPCPPEADLGNLLVLGNSLAHVLAILDHMPHEFASVLKTAYATLLRKGDASEEFGWHDPDAIAALGILLNLFSEIEQRSVLVITRGRSDVVRLRAAHGWAAIIVKFTGKEPSRSYRGTEGTSGEPVGEYGWFLEVMEFFFQHVNEALPSDMPRMPETASEIVRRVQNERIA